MIERDHSGGFEIVAEHDGRCGGGEDQDCPICRGEMSFEFVEMIEQAARQQSQPMTKEEFLEWLADQAASSR